MYYVHEEMLNSLTFEMHNNNLYLKKVSRFCVLRTLRLFGIIRMIGVYVFNYKLFKLLRMYVRHFHFRGGRNEIKNLFISGEVRTVDSSLPLNRKLDLI